MIEIFENIKELNMSYILIFLITLFGFLSLKFKTQIEISNSNKLKLTPAGKILLVLIIITGFGSFCNQCNEDKKNKQKYEEQLKYQNNILFSLHRERYPIKDVSISFQIEVSLNDYPELVKYKERLKQGVNKILPLFDLNDHQQWIDYIHVGTTSPEKIINVQITPESSLYPNSVSESFAYCLFHQHCQMYFYDQEIEIYECSHFNFPDSMLPNKTKRNFKQADLKLGFGFEPTDFSPSAHSIVYNLLTEKITIFCNFKSIPDFYSSNGKITSILDLPNKQLFFTIYHSDFATKSNKLEDMYKHVKGRIESFFLTINNRIIMFDLKKIKEFKNKTSNIYYYRFSNLKNLFFYNPYTGEINYSALNN